jgi:hypothetical protein
VAGNDPDAITKYEGRERMSGSLIEAALKPLLQTIGKPRSTEKRPVFAGLQTLAAKLKAAENRRLRKVYSE